MKHKCMYGKDCKYGGWVETEGGGHAWQTRGNKYWHYLCALQEETELVKLPVDEGGKLRELMKYFGTINRFEVIDHTLDLEDGGGRVYVKWVDHPLDVSFDLQDDNRTLKVFIQKQKEGDD